jgi:hypothetical protein
VLALPVALSYTPVSLSKHHASAHRSHQHHHHYPRASCPVRPCGDCSLLTYPHSLSLSFTPRPYPYHPLKLAAPTCNSLPSIPCLSAEPSRHTFHLASPPPTVHFRPTLLLPCSFANARPALIWPSTLLRPLLTPRPRPHRVSSH